MKKALREVINALRYLVRSGSGWRMLSNDFPPPNGVLLVQASDAAFPVLNDRRSGLDARPDVRTTRGSSFGRHLFGDADYDRRTCAWLMRYRSFVLDYDQRLDVSRAMIYIALGSSFLHRMCFRRVLNRLLLFGSLLREEFTFALRRVRTSYGLIMRVLKLVPIYIAVPTILCLAPLAYSQTLASPNPLSCDPGRTEAACLLALADVATHTERDVGSSLGKLDVPQTPVALPRATNGGSRLFSEGELTLLFRNFLAAERIDGVIVRRAWVQTMQAKYVSGYTGGPVQLGFSISPFAAQSLDQRNHPGNFVYGHRLGGNGPTVFLGEYTINARMGATLIKYGLQRVSNPVLESRDILSLPPTFQGITADISVSDQLSLSTGRFSSVKARGQTSLQSLTTGYGGVNFEHIDFAGANWAYSNDGKISVYIDRASDVWDQLYLSAAHGVGDAKVFRFTGKVDSYYTRNQGVSRQGKIANEAYSLSATGERGAHSVLLGYQQIIGDQFFDYLGETWGDSLLNAMDVDYNAPHEKSAQLRYVFDGAKAGLPGFKMMMWRVQGWGADARSGAAAQEAPNSPLHFLYWKNGQPVFGNHFEFGIYPSYVFQSGRLKNAKVTLLAVRHRSDAYYSDSGNREIKLRFEVPVKIF